MPDALPTTVVDPDGLPVDLSEERWAHITSGHPELAPFLDAVLQAVRAPNRRMPGRHPNDVWFYLRVVGPSRWLKVVVRYEVTGGAWIVTAFARRSMP